MGRLSLYLPSFSADYSGACSTVFNFNYLTVMIDAACCTKNYCSYDEPRWKRDKITTLSAGIKSIDVVLGDEQRLFDQVAQAVEKLNVNGVVLLGSPVPSITGMDIKGMAQELEDMLQIPVIGLNTDGFHFYNKGQSDTYVELYKRYVRPLFHDIVLEGTSQKHHTDYINANILGMSPIDFGFDISYKEMHNWASRFDIHICSNWGMNLSEKTVRESLHADVNIVVSESGLEVARLFEDECNIPYIVGYPCLPNVENEVASLLKNAGQNQDFNLSYDFINSCEHASHPIPFSNEAIIQNRKKVLIVGDWVMSCSMRSSIENVSKEYGIDVASFFGEKPEFCRVGDTFLASEESLVKILQDGAYDIVIADPLVFRVPFSGQSIKVSFPHPAISSDLFRNDWSNCLNIRNLKE